MLDSVLQEKTYYQQNFNDLDLTGQKLHRIEFEDCSFNDCNFSNVTFSQCKFTDCTFIKCNMSLVNLGFSQFIEVVFEHCKVIGIDWTKANWPNLALFSPIKFHHCIVNHSSFYGLELKQLILVSCKVQDVDFREGDFSQSDFNNSDFSNSLFRKTKLTKVNFTEASNYHIDIYNNVITKAKFSRYQAVALLESLNIELVD